ncbi:NUDIX hydrolase [Rhizobium sp. SAFR-030]|uniref:NUDIX hydrolase n=1 Tax=Rhizobium sp. SAFR-030 TaxID=3387277 RepID=UPI003F8019AA
MSSDRIVWPGERSVVPIDRVDMRLHDGQHPFQIAEADAIARNWSLETTANPALFNGDVLLQDEVRLENGVVHARARLSDFATLLWWLKQRQPVSGGIFVASAVPMSSDGALIVIRMARHTANAGKVYFAAGSLDRSDVMPGGQVDTLGSMARELLEETGLSVAEAVADPQLYATAFNRRHYAFRLFRFPMTAQEMCRRVETHMQTDPNPEIDAVYAIRDADPQAFDYDGLTRIVLPFVFGNPRDIAG